ncbi:mitochondrial proton/calcium exchanger protein-like [Ctenocephalides felis]|uniref:mitochondrial proton/calcium exchanger protein-like n=1 Tax=Ctenocephalides felis TaxID=7515 RepID=UPI000E6E1D0C|nr:mitochondrial proton/calcium exchanger protein-like [Ctenocephalides felis]
MKLQRVVSTLARTKNCTNKYYHSHRIDLYRGANLPVLCVGHNNTFHDATPTVVLVRNFNAPSVRLCEKEGVTKPSSKVEVTVQKLKDDQKLKSQQESAENVSTVTALKPADSAEITVVKKTLKQKIIHELLHYYHGFRLLFIDLNVSRKLIWRVLNGNQLTRREHRLLVRTTADLFRLLPFSVFIIVPFMELLLPVAIKLFPGMLPSTFQTATEREDKLKQSLKVKLEMAKFLTETLDDMTLQHKDHRSELAKEFSIWFTKMRQSGAQASNEEIMKFSKLFEDEITLDSLARPQLVALCRVLEISTLGTTNFLRFQLRMKLRSLAADDKMIQKEGIVSMTYSEVQQACRARGMRAYGMPEHRLRRQLEDWINLSLNEKVPPSLLLLSRALMLPENVPVSDKLKATINALPETIVTQTKAAIGEREGKIDNKTKIEVIKEEERKIREERQEAREEEEQRKQAELALNASSAAAEASSAQELLIDTAPVIDAEKTPKVATSPVESPLAPPEVLIMGAPKTPVATEVDKNADDEVEFTKKDLEVVEDALDTLSKDKNNLVIEKEVIKDIKEEIADYQEDVEELKEAIVAAEKPKDEIKETKGAQRIVEEGNKMITKMDTVVQEIESKESEKKAKTLPLEAPRSATETQDLIDELMDAIKKVKNVPDENRLKLIENILGRIDTDKDRHIKVEDVLKVIDIVEKEDGIMSTKQLDELVQLLKKEEVIELEEKKEKQESQQKSFVPPSETLHLESSQQKKFAMDDVTKGNDLLVLFQTFSHYQVKLC